MEDIDDKALRRLASFAKGDCPSTAALESYVDRGDAAIEAHLRACPRCVNRVVDVRGLMLAVQSQEDPPARVVAEVLAAATSLASETGNNRRTDTRRPARKRTPARTSTWRIPATLVALAASVALAVSLSLRTRSVDLSPHTSLLENETVETHESSTADHAAKTTESSAMPDTSASEQVPSRPHTRSIPSDLPTGGTAQIGPTTSLEVLAAPDDIRTISPSPTLYWYCRSAQPIDLIFRLTRLDSGDAIAIVPLAQDSCVGLSGFRTGDSGIRLDRGVAYRWTVRTPDGATISSGRISYEPSSESTSTTPQGSLARSEELLKRGLWYDSLDALAGCLSTGCNTASATRQWSRLMETAQIASVPFPKEGPRITTAASQ